MLDAAGQQDRAARLKHQMGDSPALIPYTGEPGHFTLYSYAAVLNNQVPASAFKNKYVIVGSWGTGLGDSFPTPLSDQGENMSGIEILANVLQSALTDSWISTPNAWQGALIAALPVLLICLLLRRLSPRRCFFVAIVMLLLVFVADWLFMRYAQVWIAPTASLIGIALAGPVWSWRSQEAALQHIDRELLKLQEERSSSRPGIERIDTAPQDESLSARVLKLHDAIAQVRHLRDGEQKAARQREETLRFISHDMRSPQNSILALTELQNHPQTQLPQTELLQRIDQYAHKTLTLVEGFIQLARAESMEIHYRSLNLVDLLNEACDDYWVLAKQRNIELSFTHGASFAYMNGDPSVLGRAFGNLIDNAIKYSPDHTRISCQLTEEGRCWIVRIQDQGRGIGAAGQASLFTPFIRLDESTPQNPSGSGLGLAFVKTIVERHSGTIAVSSHAGQGAVFTIRLPATG
jgi:signal transduction histidine kinase